MTLMFNKKKKKELILIAILNISQNMLKNYTLIIKLFN